ncbi:MULTISPECIES: HAD family hydrolase [Streptomycetaceae]|uniref:Putative dehalogenase/phosphatase n=2 Tax=Streptantibioticus cattleyicolor TaxID=29303 RepID=F8JPG6_STREN|nr:MULTISPECIES: HAD family hydrolase [Streptomycetaceae]AEW96529.1 putative dehalogenase/phosphatase [Streptantibioticus cattleyicolor NRRL 8057 = DSM 46488]MYS61029.1 HAD-IA family hydrolase [Streptomyces sp. SID5468]CAJ20003.1 putative dehalogenase/phosphatase [Streptantibioticus cattleyicolor]CCB76864.1 putative dehalogenase/phosphatase [Streptantibioticus cattleyicolor NRRL 8057 = DSM 46488]
MRVPPQLVIFDCDGILVDSEPLAIRAHVAVGAELGWPLTEDEVVDLFVGRSNASVDELIAARLGAPAAATWRRRFEALHREAVDTELTAVPGITEALAAIPVPTCVASSGTHAKMRHTLGRTGLYDHFAGRIYSATDVRHGKPAPDLFLHAAASMGVPPSACVVVEDSHHGLQAARAAAIPALAYASGVTPEARLRGPGTVVFREMRELPGLLGVG